MNRKTILALVTVTGCLALANPRPAAAATDPVDPDAAKAARIKAAHAGNDAPVSVPGGYFLPSGGFGSTRSTWVTSVSPATAKTEKAPFLGIAPSSVEPALRANLDLPPGVGLVVEKVDPDSPAAAAGVQQYDILQKFNDQLLIDTRQFAVLVHLAKPGDQVTLSLLRKGKPLTLKATLVERELPAFDPDTNNPWQKAFQFGMPPGSNSYIRTSRSDTLPGVKKALDILARSGAAPARIMYSDPDRTVAITDHDHSRRLIATDRTGKVLFDGPIDTDAQRKALPPEIAATLKTLESRMQSLDTPDDGSVRIRTIHPDQPAPSAPSEPAQPVTPPAPPK